MKQYRLKKVQEMAKELGATVEKRDIMITPWGWKNLQYTVDIKDYGRTSCENLNQAVEYLEEYKKYLEEQKE